MAYLIPVFTILIIDGGCSKHGHLPSAEGSRDHVSQPTDSLYTGERALDIYATQPERAMTIIDSAMMVGNLTDNKANLLRAVVLSRSQNMQRQDSAILICQALLNTAEATHDQVFRQDILELLVNASFKRYDYEELVRWTVELSQLQRSQGEETEVLRTETGLGLALTHVGQLDEGLEKIDRAIRTLDGVRRFNEFDTWLIAVKRKINVLRELGDHEAQVVELANRMQQRLDDFVNHSGDYHDGTFREPDSTDVYGYYDCYYAQALAFKADAYAIQGETATAQRVINTFRQYDYSRSLDGRMMIAKTLGRLGDYAGMLDTFDEVERCMMSEDDTLNGIYVMMLHDRADAAYALGQTAESHALMTRYDNLRQKLNDDLQHSKAHLFAVRFKTQEQQMALRQQETETRLNRIIAAVAVAISLFALGFAIYYFYQQRLIRRKNRILIEQMKEAMDYKRKWETDQHARQKQEQSTSGKPDTQLAATSPDVSDAELYQYIRETILHERLYISPQFDRQAAITFFHLSKKRIVAAFSHGSEYASIAEFINSCRLEHARELLTANPEMTIDDIASASGFGTRRTFSRIFKERYSISPSEYRSQNSSANH